MQLQGMISSIERSQPTNSVAAPLRDCEVPRNSAVVTILCGKPFQGFTDAGSRDAVTLCEFILGRQTLTDFELAGNNRGA